MDSIWGSLEGKFNKFVSGEDLPVVEPESRKSTEIVGSSVPETSLPARSASAVDMRYNNGASADWSRRATTPQSGKYGIGMRSISPGNQFGMGGLQGFSPLKPEEVVEEENTSSFQADSYGGTPNNESAYSYGQPPPKGVFSPFGQIQADTVDETQNESYQSYQPYGEDTAGGGWWSGGANDMAADPGANIDSNQYNTPVNSYEPQHSYEPSPNMNSNYDDDDDLGLGNSSTRKGKKDDAQAQNSVPSKPSTPAPAAEKSEKETDEKKEGDEKQGNYSEFHVCRCEVKEPRANVLSFFFLLAEPKGGWGLFSIFSRSNTSTPSEKKSSVRANLGEENSFYYDKDLKRWVNKKVRSVSLAYHGVEITLY